MYRAVFTWLYYRRERQFAFEVGQIELKLLALSMPARRKLMWKNTDKIDTMKINLSTEICRRQRCGGF